MIYGMTTSDFENEIQQFFQGKNNFENLRKGYVWVCHHNGFDTLTLESIHGQYEIAVRFPTKEDGRLFWAGYWCDPMGFLHGVNTGVMHNDKRGRES